MENRFRTVEQRVDYWAFWGIAGRYGCAALALLFWFGLVETTPYSYVAWLLRAALSSYPAADFPALYEITDWFFGGFFWLMVGAVWLAFVRRRVAALEAGSKAEPRQSDGPTSS